MKRILLVDDELTILQVLRTILTSDGHSVETAWSSPEALREVERQHFDLVITDFNLSDMKGDELAVRIKEKRPGTPVLMLTGSADILKASGRSMPGVDVLMSKPWNLAELRHEVAGLLANKAVSATPAFTHVWSDRPQQEAVLAELVPA